MVTGKKDQILILEEDIASAILSLEQLEDYLYLNSYPVILALFCDIMNRASIYLPDYRTFFQVNVKVRQNAGAAIGCLKRTLKMIEREKKFETNIKEKKLFLSAEDKLESAGKSFEDGDYPSTFNNLNTALELVLKDTLHIPLTITKINTSDIINVLVKERLGPIQHIKEVQKHVLIIDNKIKHQGYNPIKIDSINAIKAMEDFLGELNKKKMEIPNDVREKLLNMV